MRSLFFLRVKPFKCELHWHRRRIGIKGVKDISNQHSLQKRPDESPLGYHKRLVYGKLVDKTLADFDYSELSGYVYGKDYSTDVARRMMYGSCRTLSLLEDQQVDDARNGADDIEDLLEELEVKRIDLMKEQQRFYDQRREYRKLVREDGRREHLDERLALAAENLGSLYKPIPERRKPALSHDGRDAVLVFADWHYGMTTYNIWNEYDTDIFRRRLRNVLDEAEERISINGVRDLHIVVLGDLIHGGIHTSARVASNELVCDQLMQASEYLARAIAELSEYANHTYVYCTYGNHARTIQNKKDNLHRDNMERIIPWWLRERMKDIDRVTIEPESDTEFIHFNVRGYGFCAAHGDLDSVKNSPRLLYSLFEKKYGETIDVILLGDKHHRESFEELGVMSVITSALCGSDEYANNHRLYSTPGQLMITVTDKGVDATYNLRCE